MSWCQLEKAGANSDLIEKYDWPGSEESVIRGSALEREAASRKGPSSPSPWHLPRLDYSELHILVIDVNI